MLLYDVYYPHGKSYDRNVPWSYLEKLAEDGKHNGAVATCVNGDRISYTLKDGEWTKDRMRPTGG